MSNEKNGREVILSVRHVDISFEVGHKKKFDAVKDANFDIYNKANAVMASRQRRIFPSVHKRIKILRIAQNDSSSINIIPRR